MTLCGNQKGIKRKSLLSSKGIKNGTNLKSCEKTIDY
jgi:hypothetical protein